MSALDRILDYKRDEVAALLSHTSEAELHRRAMESEAEPPRGFNKALDTVAATDENALICELKRKSPSAGEILPGADPVEIAQAYRDGGAACLSVLTDGTSFGGALDDLTAIRSAVALPILRKDFMIHPAQVFETRVHGADAILIIMAALDDAAARDIASAADACGLDCLIEVHDAAELDRALALNLGLIGINNRNLKTMVTDLGTTEGLASRFPTASPFVSESGVRTVEDVTRLRASGARRFLIGESLMKQAARSQAVRALRRAGTN